MRKGDHLSEESKLKLSESLKKVHGTPESRKANSDRVKKYFESSEARKRHSEIQKKVKCTPEYRKKASERTKKYYEEHPEAGKKHIEFMKKRLAEHPEISEKHSEAMKQRFASEEARKNQSETLKRYYAETPNARQKNSESIKKYFATPGACAKHSEMQKRIKASPEWRQKQSESLLRSFSNSWWYGAVTYKTNPHYCVKFRIVKPKVRAFFNYTCVVCGKKEIREMHSVHHVFYDKEACCLQDVDGVYYSNLHSVDHNDKDYCIGENPNYFVLLCRSCHGKANGKFETRAKWADRFKELIDTKYGGVCYTEIQTLK